MNNRRFYLVFLTAKSQKISQADKLSYNRHATKIGFSVLKVKIIPIVKSFYIKKRKKSM
jgi:hypothetical protein